MTIKFNITYGDKNVIEKDLEVSATFNTLREHVCSHFNDFSSKEEVELKYSGFSITGAGKYALNEGVFPLTFYMKKLDDFNLDGRTIHLTINKKNANTEQKFSRSRIWRWSRPRSRSRSR